MKPSPFLLINTVLLLTATFSFAYALASASSARDAFSREKGRQSRGYEAEELRRYIRKYPGSIIVKMNLIEKMEIMLIDKSNIRHYIPFMNIYLLLLVSAVIFAATLGPVYRVLLFIPSAVVLCGIFSMIPFFILDLMGRYNSEKIRRKLAEFISVLNRWCAVREDIFYAFEKSTVSGTSEPLRTFIRDMTIQVRLGMDPIEALDILQLKVDNIQFRDFIVNIKQNIRFRGDMTRLLTNLETQYYKLEEEYNRRKISTFKDRLLVFILMGSVLVTGYFFFKFNSRVEQYYLSTVDGKFLMGFFIALFAFGVYFSFGIARFKH